MYIKYQQKNYRLGARRANDGNEYIVQVRGLIWHTVKVFKSDDDEYAYNCAVELYEMLIDDIEPKPINRSLNG